MSETVNKRVWIADRGKTVYHLSRDCQSLKQSRHLRQITVDPDDTQRSLCQHCADRDDAFNAGGDHSYQRAAKTHDPDDVPALSDSRETVFLTAATSGVFHTDEDCPAVSEAANVRQVDRQAQAGRRALCERCKGETYGSYDIPLRWNDAGDDGEEVPGGD